MYALGEDVPTYNTMRPQYSLQGNNAEEIFSGKPLDINHYKNYLYSKKTLRTI
ncbi:hypothetical protein [Flavobacterium sp.]|uniref:hypothetical protein n=1 Tax=Flavobacterium sp. TaxID=239 RepID=UPI003751F22D